MNQAEGQRTAKSISVFIVEDHEFTRLGLKMSLEQMDNLRVVGEAKDGAEGIEKILALKPDVVLMDIEMPVMDGVEATHIIKNKAGGTRVIMLSSHKNDETIFAALSAGANGYCLKNISAQQLASVIRMVAEGAIWLDPGIANRVLSVQALTDRSAGERHEGSLFAEGAQPDRTAKTPAGKPAISLSPRETEVLRLVADGLSNQQIAEKLVIGIETVKTHMRHIMEKLAVSDRTEAAVKAMKQGIF